MPELRDHQRKLRVPMYLEKTHRRRTDYDQWATQEMMSERDGCSEEPRAAEKHSSAAAHKFELRPEVISKRRSPEASHEATETISGLYGELAQLIKSRPSAGESSELESRIKSRMNRLRRLQKAEAEAMSRSLEQSLGFSIESVKLKLQAVRNHARKEAQMLATRNPSSKKTSSRRHTPKPRGGEKGYQKYLECLRWEFGFTCPLCLLHETELQRFPRSGVLTVEHYYLRSTAPEQKNSYGNCLLACRFCNLARNDQPTKNVRGGRLLRPDKDAWAKHFFRHGDYICPETGDGDAEYTEQAYDLNDPRKVEARSKRRELIGSLLEIIEILRDPWNDTDQLMNRIEHSESNEIRLERLSYAESIHTLRKQAVRIAEEHPPVPCDAPTKCRCKDKEVLRLPEQIEQHLIEGFMPV